MNSVFADAQGRQHLPVDSQYFIIRDIQRNKVCEMARAMMGNYNNINTRYSVNVTNAISKFKRWVISETY